LVGELHFTILASGTTTVSNFGKSYTTSVPFSYHIPLTKIGRDLKDHVFKFSNSEYKVQPGSIKERKAKKNTPNFG
jgi:hypothetical protein